jgi:undecaprenyl-diphosphatase
VVPVSSSAQLVLLPWLLGWTPARDRTTFAAGLHAGSCVGIGWALREELRALDRRTLLLVAGASLPAAVVGAVAADAVEQRLGRPPQLAALLAGAGLVMWAVDARAERRAASAGEQAGPSAGGRPPGRAALRSPRWCPGSRVRAPP